jgi:hypothetical protein
MQQENFSQVDPAKLQAQKEYKQMKELFRSTIYIAVKEQRIFKKQANAKGGEQSAASQSTVAINGFDLRCLYIAYALFRRFYGGYTKFPEPYSLLTCQDNQLVKIHQGTDRPISEKYINDLIQKYVPKTVYTG